MQSAVVVKPIQQAADVRRVSIKSGFDRTSALSELIAQRAFEIFQCRGRVHGNDLNDWYQAEAELFHTVHVHVYESDDALAVEAEVPGFHAEELEVGIEPRRIAITGRRATNFTIAKKILYGDGCADRVFRALGLPLEVDPKKAAATLKDGILRLALPKVSPAREPGTRIYALVRAEDARLYTQSFTGRFGSNR